MWTEEEFQAWKHDPKTQGFLRFLAEVREDLKARWANGEEMTPHQQSMAQTYGDIVDMNYERDVVPFYEDETEETEDHDGSE